MLPPRHPKNFENFASVPCRKTQLRSHFTPILFVNLPELYQLGWLGMYIPTHPPVATSLNCPIPVAVLHLNIKHDLCVPLSVHDLPNFCCPSLFSVNVYKLCSSFVSAVEKVAVLQQTMDCNGRYHVSS